MGKLSIERLVSPMVPVSLLTPTPNN